MGKYKRVCRCKKCGKIYPHGIPYICYKCGTEIGTKTPTILKAMGLGYGGVGKETETIRDEAVKWNNYSSKRVPYEFIDYVEGKREICVSDNVCEWKVKSNYYVTECSHDTDVMYGLKQDFKFCPYCGKKIKVVVE